MEVLYLEIGSNVEEELSKVLTAYNDNSLNAVELDFKNISSGSYKMLNRNYKEVFFRYIKELLTKENTRFVMEAVNNEWAAESNPFQSSQLNDYKLTKYILQNNIDLLEEITACIIYSDQNADKALGKSNITNLNFKKDGIISNLTKDASDQIGRYVFFCKPNKLKDKMGLLAQNIQYQVRA